MGNVRPMNLVYIKFYAYLEEEELHSNIYKLESNVPVTVDHGLCPLDSYAGNLLG